MGKREFDNLLMDKLEHLYGMEIPDEIAVRCVRERNYLMASKFQDEFWVFAELLMQLQKNNIKYSIIGTASHSFLLYLLLQPDMNPLPPHYYCPQCKDVVFVDCNDELIIGIDLPRMRCECGCELRGDGFNLSDELFWEIEPLNLLFSVSEENYEFVKKWLCRDERLKCKVIREERGDDESILKVFRIGIISVLVEKKGSLIERKFGWDEIRKHKEKVYDNFELLLPCNQKIKCEPRSLYEVIRILAYFSTMYTKNVSDCVCEEDILDPDEMCVLLEKFYDNDISKVPVFVEDGLMLGEWCVEDYHFLLLYTRAYADIVLDEINEKMSDLFEEE